MPKKPLPRQKQTAERFSDAPLPVANYVVGIELVLKYQEKCARPIQIYFASALFTTSYCIYFYKRACWMQLQTSREGYP